MIFFMCFSMHFESLLIALKKTDTVFRAALVGSWGGQVPAVLLLFYFSGKTLQNVLPGHWHGICLAFCPVHGTLLANRYARSCSQSSCRE